MPLPTSTLVSAVTLQKHPLQKCERTFLHALNNLLYICEKIKKRDYKHIDLRDCECFIFLFVELVYPVNLLIFTL